jgi:hypothetical protein
MSERQEVEILLKAGQAKTKRWPAWQGFPFVRRGALRKKIQLSIALKSGRDATLSLPYMCLIFGGTNGWIAYAGT